MDEICLKYQIRESKDITEEILQHYFDVGDKEATEINRSIFFLNDDVRKDDYRNPITADKLQLFAKGIHIDNCCKILGIEKTGDYAGFHKQITGQEIYEDDVIGSDWYKQIALHKDLKKFVQEHQEEIINLLKEPKTFNRYLKLSGYEPIEDLSWTN